MCIFFYPEYKINSCQSLCTIKCYRIEVKIYVLKALIRKKKPPQSLNFSINNIKKPSHRVEIYNARRNTEDLTEALNFLFTASSGKTQSKDYQLPWHTHQPTPLLIMQRTEISCYTILYAGGGWQNFCSRYQKSKELHSS